MYYLRLFVNVSTWWVGHGALGSDLVRQKRAPLPQQGNKIYPEAAEQRTESWFSSTKQIVKILCTMEIENESTYRLLYFCRPKSSDEGDGGLSG
ncbi:BDN_1c_G0000010.mRNA.1.CDS.1 [Saccharomyces cerevisiae]|nr:BDN_1c_G0000010.mRNA.1.CDS.1 [Saccharomyces cerevisiae]CAI7032809.1 BDN_1c_G0000010.mRNA.1.CDS.1 [Saccharomyces cerevisiae]